MSASDARTDQRFVEASARSHRLVWVLLVAVGAVHFGSLFGEFVYDDRVLVTGNAALMRGDLAQLLTAPFFGPGGDYWRPLTSLGLWLGYTIGGAAGIHLLAWLAHLGATLFAWRIAVRLTADSRAAFFAALLFGVHPVQVEAVAWCSACNDPLWLCLGLASLDAALRSSLPTMAVCFVCAMLAKENAIVLLPLVLLARWQAKLPIRFPAAVLLAALGAWWVLRALVFGSVGEAAVDPVVAARWPSAALELFGRELGLLLWPWPMSPFRSLQFDARALTWASIAAVAFVGLLAASLVRGRRTASLCLVMVGAQPLLAALVCERIGAYPIADRYLGLSVLGASVWLFGNMRGRWLIGTGSALATIAGLASIDQALVWRGPARLVQHGLEVTEGDPGLHVMAGNLALESGATAVARAHYEASLAGRRNPAELGTRRVTIDAHLGLGWCHLGAAPANVAAALGEFTRVIETDADNAFAWIGLGVAHGMAGDDVRAEQALRRAIDLDSGNAEAHFNLAYLFEQQGRRSEARSRAAAVLERDPGHRAAAELLRRLR